MAIPINILRQVQTYQEAGLAFLQNSYCFLSKSNKKFQNFQDKIGQLGQTVTFELPYRYIGTDSLVVTFEPTEQRYYSLTVSKERSVAVAFDVQQFVYNVKDYMDKMGKAAVAELGASVESDLAYNALSHTYRFYGDGVTPINSFGQLAYALAKFRNYGASRDKTRGILSDIAVPAIVNTGLNQFVTNRNNEIANSWELGSFSNCEWMYSNLLSTHYAGNVGNNGNVLTVVSTNDPTGANITQITFSGADLTDADAIKENDLLEFQDGVTGQPNVRYLTFIGHKPSENTVQIRATSNSGSDGSGNVIVDIFPALCADITSNKDNITTNIVAGMKVKALPSHRAGLIYSGDALYLGMPRLPQESPFETASETDPETGASFRMYYGSRFGENTRGIIHDCIWGSTLVDEYAMRLVFPM